ncbi:transporter [Candidatus Poribacteria bacterium]|nr:transporter [Candidatus Poribacteria bacterium]
METGGEIGTIISYGITDHMDIVTGLPYIWNKVMEDDTAILSKAGISDIPLELKWRFYEKESLSMALKPGVTFPTGDEEKGLGAGKISSSLYLITTKEKESWIFHFNLGHLYNDNKLDERKDLWHISLATLVNVKKDLKVVANIGTDTNTDKESNVNSSFILGGFIYSISENFDIDAGIKNEINKTNYSILMGMALRI